MAGFQSSLKNQFFTGLLKSVDELDKEQKDKMEYRLQEQGLTIRALVEEAYRRIRSFSKAEFEQEEKDFQ